MFEGVCECVWVCGGVAGEISLFPHFSFSIFCFEGPAGF